MAEPLLTPREMQETDRRAIAAGTPGLDLMERAGLAVADAAAAMAPAGGRILVLCGPGNNGGDGFIAARILTERGFEVRLALLGDRERLSGDAGEAARRWPGTASRAETADPRGFDLVIDALFGAGLSRDLQGLARALVERINAAERPVLAVDVPSGIDGETGQARGAAIRAARTITFVTRKPGHLLLPGRIHCGPVTVADIGIPADLVARAGARAFANGPALWTAQFPRLGLDAHKYVRGHTLVASGGATRTGAARLAARAALRIGSGLVTLASPPEALGVNAAQLTAVMLRGCDGAEGLASILEDRRFNALVLGPALGIHSGTRAMVGVALQARRALVLDADALTSFGGMAADLAGRFAAAPAILTPHGGEFSRLFGGIGDVLEVSSKLEQARRAAAYTGAGRGLQGSRHGGRGAGRAGGHQRERHPGPRHRGLRRRALRLHRGPPRAGDAGVRGGVRGGVDPRGGGRGVRARADREDLPDLAPGVLRRLLAR
jgi:NAD(P)H-hydrate epimerase